eukprot:SM000161S02444  [mRNA]  locus=s161:202673:207507:- [translate_table: standard]
MADIYGEDDFDFGGDDPEEGTKERGAVASKRPFDDLEEEDDDLYPAKKIYGDATAGEELATTTILNLRGSLEAKEKHIKSLQEKLDTAILELGQWQQIFESGALSGLSTQPSQRDSCKIRAAKRRENAMLAKLSAKEQEITDLKGILSEMKEMMKPEPMQTRKLLLDPVNHAEFTRLKTELEAAEKKAKDLQNDLAAVRFTPDSKNGKMLMAKCRTLQEENEEIGREASEGKMHELENKLAIQKQLNAELRKGYQELQEYVDDINDDAEKLQTTLYGLHRQVQQQQDELQALRGRPKGGSRGGGKSNGRLREVGGKSKPRGAERAEQQQQRPPVTEDRHVGNLDDLQNQLVLTDVQDCLTAGRLPHIQWALDLVKKDELVGARPRYDEPTLLPEPNKLRYGLIRERDQEKKKARAAQ